MKVGNHPHVYPYDGAFKCYACGESWGAVYGNPPRPEKCERKERRKKDRRTKEQPGEQKWILVPARANVQWSGRLKGKYPDSSNYELQQLINEVLDAAPPPPERP